MVRRLIALSLTMGDLTGFSQVGNTYYNKLQPGSRIAHLWWVASRRWEAGELADPVKFHKIHPKISHSCRVEWAGKHFD